MDAADRELFERSVGQAIEGRSGPDLDTALAELGWDDAYESDPRAAVAVLFERQGAAGAASSALARVLGSGVLPPLGASTAPGRIDGDHVLVDGLALGTTGSTVLVATDAGDLVEVTASELDVTPVHGIDPTLGLFRVSGTASLRARSTPATGWDESVARARLALSHELVGASRRMLELAREHALERVQFGVPISSFQAVRHRLADALVAIETADAMLDAAWQDGSPGTAAMAKALAGHGSRTVSRHCQQVLAGIGFTTEHPFHAYAKRVLVLDELLGSARTLTRALGEELVRTRRLPEMLPL
jgi:hypothetical protein